MAKPPATKPTTKTKEEEKPKSKALAKAAASGPPAALAAAMEADAGKGVSSAAEDNIIPLVRIFQALSPQVNPRKPEHIEGAEVGKIWLKGAPEPIIDGEEGFIFQACYAYKQWVEWRPNRGGFAGSHPTRPKDAVEKTDPTNPKKKIWMLPNGNSVVETRYRAGFIMNEDLTGGVPYVIPFTSSGHTVARTWNTLAMQQKISPTKVAPLWACYYHLTTDERTNNEGQSWFAFEVEHYGWVADQEGYDRGLSLHNAFASGEKAAEALDDEGPAGGGGSSDDGDDGKDLPEQRM